MFCYVCVSILKLNENEKRKEEVNVWLCTMKMEMNSKKKVYHFSAQFVLYYVYISLLRWTRSSLLSLWDGIKKKKIHNIYLSQNVVTTTERKKKKIFIYIYILKGNFFHHHYYDYYYYIMQYFQTHS